MFTFTTRDEYLQQKKEWFAAYKAQIKQIRQLKLDYKQAQRDGVSVYSVVLKQRQAYSDLEKLQQARYESRREAQRQYELRMTETQ